MRRNRCDLELDADVLTDEVIIVFELRSGTDWALDSGPPIVPLEPYVPISMRVGLSLFGLSKKQKTKKNKKKELL